MRYLNLKLNNSKFMLTHLKPNSSDPIEHDHGNDYQITLPISGRPFLELNNKSNPLNNNVRMITSPGEKHLHFTRENESKILLININKNFIEKVIASRLNKDLYEVAFNPSGEGSSERLVKITNEVIRENLLPQDDSVRTEELEWDLAETFLSIHEGSHSEIWKQEVVLKHHPLLKKVVKYINENYKYDLSLDDLSKESNLSKYHMIRIFKEVLGTTPSHYILNIRLEKAVELLIKSKLDITTICFEVGFGSLNTFERVFKKRFGNTISEFRKSHKI